MPNKCCVPGCKSNYKSINCGYVSKFKFPTDAELREKWIEGVRRKDWMPSKSSVVCANHFLLSDIIASDKYTDKHGVEHVLPRKNPALKKDAYPTVFPGIMKSHHLLLKNSIKLESVSETEWVYSSDKEVVPETRVFDKMESETPPSVKIEQPEVYIDYPDQEIPPSSQVHSSVIRHTQNEMCDGIKLELVKQELPDTLYEDNNCRFSTMGDKASYSYQGNTGYNNAKSTVTENGCLESLKQENCQMSENMSFVIKSSNFLFLNEKNLQLQNVENELVHANFSQNSLGLSVGFADRASHGPQTEDMSGVYNPVVSVEKHLNRSETFAQEKSHKCDVCKASFTNSRQLKYHRRKHTGQKPYMCNKCGDSFPLAVYLNQLLNCNRKKHIGEKSFKYDTIFVCSHKRTSHMKIHPEEKPYKCDGCGDRFTGSIGLKNHQRMHTGEKPYKCDDCGACFTHSSTLINHMRLHIHKGEKPYKCDDCGASFSNSGNLNVHKRTHTEDQPYKCDVCSISFTRLSSLIYHRRTHTGEKPYLCDVCGASFSNCHPLKNHQRKHTGEKPYKCDVCGASFSQSRSLKIHYRTHTGEGKPYKCRVCSISFSDLSTIKKHERLHTGEKHFKCDQCDVSFARSGSLKKHQLTHTGEEQ